MPKIIERAKTNFKEAWKKGRKNEENNNSSIQLVATQKISFANVCKFMFFFQFPLHVSGIFQVNNKKTQLINWLNKLGIKQVAYGEFDIRTEEKNYSNKN